MNGDGCNVNKLLIIMKNKQQTAHTMVENAVDIFTRYNA